MLRFGSLVVSPFIAFAASVGLTQDAGAASTSRAMAVTAGEYHTCALTKAGTVACWGINNNGQLGDGTDNSTVAPVAVQGLTGVVAIVAGHYHTCALTKSGRVKCWGANNHGQIGDDSTTDRLTPTDVSGLGSGVLAIGAGEYHTCAVTAAGAAMCWGQNQNGQLGNGTLDDSHLPGQVTGLSSGIAAIAGGVNHTCAVTSAGQVKCWGDNSNGQLGNGTRTNERSPRPVLVRGIRGATAVATGQQHSCAIAGGRVKCWGFDSDGQLGDGGNTEQDSPVATRALGTDVAAIDAGLWHNCALLADGRVKCWGFNSDGQIGNGTGFGNNAHTPVLVKTIRGATAIATGSRHGCAIIKAGNLRCWGQNDGQIGDGTTVERDTPVDVTGF